MSALHQQSHSSQGQHHPLDTQQPHHHGEHLTLPETIGKRVDPVYSKTLHARVKEILQTHHDSFPGSEPVSFEAKHLANLECEDYYVCEKTNGVRYLLFFVHSPKGPATFLFDRNGIWYYVPNLVFPVRGREKEYLKDTLMDGELVADTNDGKISWRFLVFDLMALNGVSVIQRSVNTRLGMLQQDVVHPFIMSQRRPSLPDKSPPFTIELKKMERAYGLHLVFDQMSKVKHSTDGVIWTPVKRPYTPGTFDKLLKWKPPELYTVDFRISARWSKEHKPMYALEILTNVQTYKFYDHFQPEQSLATEWKNNLPDGRIAEFRYDAQLDVTIVEQGYAPTTRKGGWRFVRFRDDKKMANNEATVRMTLNSIRDGITKDQLLSHMERVRTAWKAREKGLPIPPPISIKPSESPSSDTAKLAVPLPTPVLPSPSGSSNSGYFHSKDMEGSSSRRQSTVDSASQPADRRRSEADTSTTRESREGGATTEAREPTKNDALASNEPPKARANPTLDPLPQTTPPVENTVAGEKAATNRSAAPGEATASKETVAPSETTAPSESVVPSESNPTEKSTVPSQNSVTADSAATAENTAIVQATTTDESASSSEHTAPDKGATTTDSTVSADISVETSAPSESAALSDHVPSNEKAAPGGFTVTDESATSGNNTAPGDNAATGDVAYGLASKREYKAEVQERKRFKTWDGEDHPVASDTNPPKPKQEVEKSAMATKTNVEAAESTESKTVQDESDSRVVEEKAVKKEDAGKLDVSMSELTYAPNQQSYEELESKIVTVTENPSLGHARKTPRRRKVSETMPTTVAIPGDGPDRQKGRQKERQIEPSPRKAVKMRRLDDTVEIKQTRIAIKQEPPQHSPYTIAPGPQPMGPSVSNLLLASSVEKDKRLTRSTRSKTVTSETTSASNSIHHLLTTSVEPTAMRGTGASSYPPSASETYPYSEGAPPQPPVERKQQQPYEFSTILHTSDTQTHRPSKEEPTMAPRRSYYEGQPSGPQEAPTYERSKPPVQFINYHVEGPHIQATPTSRSVRHDSISSSGKSRGSVDWPPLPAEGVDRSHEPSAEHSHHMAKWRSPGNASGLPDVYEHTRQQPGQQPSMSQQPSRGGSPSSHNLGEPDRNRNPAAVHPYYQHTQHPSYSHYAPYPAHPFHQQQQHPQQQQQQQPPPPRTLSQPLHLSGPPHTNTTPEPPQGMHSTFQHHRPSHHDLRSVDPQHATHAYQDYPPYGGSGPIYPDQRAIRSQSSVDNNMPPPSERYPRQETRSKRSSKATLDFILN